MWVEEEEEVKVRDERRMESAWRDQAVVITIVWEGGLLLASSCKEGDFRTESISAWMLLRRA